MNLSVSFLGHDPVQARQPLDGRHVQRRIGHHQHAFVFRIDQIFERLGRVFGFDRALVIEHADDAVAADRAEARIDLVLGIFFRRRRIVLGDHAFVRHDQQRIGVVQTMS